MEEKIIVGRFKTRTGGIFTAERRAKIGELVFAKFTPERGHDVAAPPTEHTPRHPQVAAGDGAFGLARIDGRERIHDRRRIGVRTVGHNGSILHLEGVAERIVSAGIGALKSPEQKTFANVGEGLVLTIDLIIESGTFPRPRLPDLTFKAGGDSHDIG